MFRKKTYLVVLVRATEDDEYETKGVDVEARTSMNAKRQALLTTPGLWSVFVVSRGKRK